VTAFGPPLTRRNQRTWQLRVKPAEIVTPGQAPRGAAAALEGILCACCVKLRSGESPAAHLRGTTMSVHGIGFATAFGIEVQGSPAPPQGRVS